MQTDSYNFNADSSGGNPSNVHEKKMSSASLFVALYLVILAFFILLNSISSIKKKDNDEILDGVRSTFKLKQDERTSDIKIDNINLSGNDPSIIEYSKRIGNLARDSVTLIQATVIEDGPVTQISIPVSDFFNKNKDSIQRKHQNFIQSLAAELANIKEGLRIDVEISISPSESQSSEYDTEDNLSLARVSNLANSLIRNGVSNKSMLVGIDSALDQSLVMRFYVRFNIEEAAYPDVASEESGGGDGQ